MKTIIAIITSKIFLALFIIFLFILLMNQCNRSSKLEKDVKREYNNYISSLDTIKTISYENGKLIQEKGAYELKNSEITKENKELIKKLEIEKNKKPETVIQTVTIYKDSIVNIATTIESDIQGEKSINFIYNPKLPGKNLLRIQGKTPFEISLIKDIKDTNKHITKIIPGKTTLEIQQNIEMTAAIYRDKKTKRLMARVVTEFPNITFGELNAFTIIDNKESKKEMYSARKIFGIGINIGYGITGLGNTIRFGPYIGIGLQYSPKFLQF